MVSNALSESNTQQVVNLKVLYLAQKSLKLQWYFKFIPFNNVWKFQLVWIRFGRVITKRKK